MKTFTIEFPAPTEPATPANLTARALGIHPWIVALVTLGWPAAPLVHHTENSAGPALHPTWYVGSVPARRDRSQSAASALIHAATNEKLPAAKRLAPAHPWHFIAAALASLAHLNQWREKGGSLTAITVPGTAACIATAGTPVPPPVCTLGVAHLSLAAALIACGFTPAPAPVYSESMCGVGFADDPLRPGLLLQCDRLFVRCLEEISAGRSYQPLTAAAVLESAAPGEHPFLYALPALLNFPGMLQRQEITARNAVLVRQSPYHPDYRVLVSNALMQGQDPRSRRIKDLAHKHLSAVPA